MEQVSRLVFAFLAHWPLRRLHALGWALGWMAYALSAEYRKRLNTNAALARCATTQRRASVGHAGKMVAELPRAWLGEDVPVQWCNPELLERAFADRIDGKPRGLLLLTPHMGGFDFVGRSYAARFGSGRPDARPMTVLYRPPRQVWMRDFMRQSRQRPGMLPVATDLSGVKAMLKALKAGQTVGLLPDQVPPEGMGEWLPVFGKPAYTMTLAARLIAQTQANVIWLWGQRLPGGAGFVVHARESSAGAGEGADGRMRVLQGELEALVREGADQYIWGYNRYKAPKTITPSGAAPSASRGSA